jgi:hypothetical protein
MISSYQLIQEEIIGEFIQVETRDRRCIRMKRKRETTEEKYIK